MNTSYTPHEAFLVQRGDFGGTVAEHDTIEMLQQTAAMICDVVPPQKVIDVYSGTSAAIVRSADVVYGGISATRKADRIAPNSNWEFQSAESANARYSSGIYDAIKLADVIANSAESFPVIVTNNPFIEDLFIFGNRFGVTGANDGRGLLPAFNGYGQLYGVTLEQCRQIALCGNPRALADYTAKRPDLFDDPEILKQRLERMIKQGRFVAAH